MRFKFELYLASGEVSECKPYAVSKGMKVSKNSERLIRRGVLRLE